MCLELPIFILISQVRPWREFVTLHFATMFCLYTLKLNADNTCQNIKRLKIMIMKRYLEKFQSIALHHKTVCSLWGYRSFPSIVIWRGERASGLFYLLPCCKNQWKKIIVNQIGANNITFFLVFNKTSAFISRWYYQLKLDRVPTLITYTPNAYSTPFSNPHFTLLTF